MKRKTNTMIVLLLFFLPSAICASAGSEVKGLQEVDRFFSAGVYNALKSQNPNAALEAVYKAELARASKAGESGVNSSAFPRTVEAAMVEARHQFNNALQDRGIARKEGAKAILSGEVSPHRDDLMLIYEGFTSSDEDRIAMATYAIKKNAKYSNGLAKRGCFGEEIEDAVENNGKHISDFLTPEQQIKAIATMPDWQIGGAINQYRQHMFNESYGDLASAKGVTTILKGELRPLNQTDINEAIKRYDGDVVSFITGYHKADYDKLRKNNEADRPPGPEAQRVQQFNATKEKFRVPSPDLALKSAEEIKALNRKGPVIYPTVEQLGIIGINVSRIGDEATASFVREVIEEIGRLKFYRKSDEYFSDFNTFENRSGDTIQTIRKDSEFVATILEISEPGEEILEIYSKYFAYNLRQRLDPFKSDFLGKTRFYTGKREGYVSDGSAIFNYEYDGKRLKISALRYSGREIDVLAERTNFNQIRLTPWTTRTGITLQAGQSILLKVDGKISISGATLRPGRAEDMFGFDIRNSLLLGGAQILAPFQNHSFGALLARVGDGDWVIVGKETKLIAKSDGELSLRFNIPDQEQCSGDFEITYDISL